VANHRIHSRIDTIETNIKKLLETATTQDILSNAPEVQAFKIACTVISTQMTEFMLFA
jgi:hypothetical protein